MLMISMNRKSLAPTQFQGLAFNSMVMFNGRALAASAEGVHAMGECDVDLDEDGVVDVEVDAFIETPLSDWGATNQKRIRRVYISGEFASSPMIVKTKNKEGNERSYTTTTPGADEDSVYANIGRDGKGRHWSLRIENTNGADFSIDAISVIPVILNNRR